MAAANPQGEKEEKPKEEWNTMQLTEEEKEKSQYDNWIPPSQRRPEDEFFELESVVPIRVEQVGDESLQILTLVEGKGQLAEPSDTIYYKHQTRFDNGQLVDIAEKRRVADRFIIADKQRLDFLKNSFLKMRKGQVAWLKVG